MPTEYVGKSKTCSSNNLSDSFFRRVHDCLVSAVHYVTNKTNRWEQLPFETGRRWATNIYKIPWHRCWRRFCGARTTDKRYRYTVAATVVVISAKCNYTVRCRSLTTMDRPSFAGPPTERFDKKYPCNDGSAETRWKTNLTFKRTKRLGIEKTIVPFKKQAAGTETW